MADPIIPYALSEAEREADARARAACLPPKAARASRKRSGRASPVLEAATPPASAPVSASTSAAAVVANNKAVQAITEMAHYSRAGSGIENARRSVSFEATILDDDLLPTNFLARGMLAARTVGRIEAPAALTRKGLVATGFLVGPRLLITNNHVLADPEAAGEAILSMDYDLDADGQPRSAIRYRLDPAAAFLTSDARDGCDYTLVAVQPMDQDSMIAIASFGFMRMDAATGKTRDGRFATIIQHPQGERKMIGLRENRVVQIGDPANNGEPNPASDKYIWYSTDTAPGSSGAMVCNDAWQLLSIHHAAEPERITVDGAEHWQLTDGSSAPADLAARLPLTEVKWRANQGVRVSRIIADAAAQLDAMTAAARPALITEWLGDVRGDQPYPGTQPGRSIVAPAAPAPQPPVPQPPAPQPPVPQPLTPLVAENRETVRRTTPSGRSISSRVRSIGYFADRRGYDEKFLLTEIALPTLTPAALAFGALAPIRDDPDNVLRYQHFSVLLNADRRLAFCAAVNIDGMRWVGLERGRDQWYLDPRAPLAAQIGNEFYTDEPNNIAGANQGWFDRGHIVRRRDPIWGPLANAERGNEDSFHYTNCAPQYWGFNRGFGPFGSTTGRRVWLGLEDYVLQNVRAERVRASVFNGPIFGLDDEIHRGVPVPRLYYKIVAVENADGRLFTSAYAVSQERYATNIPFEKLPIGPNSDEENFQVAVTRIEELTGLDFGPAVRSADVYTGADRLIGRLEDVALGDMAGPVG